MEKRTMVLLAGGKASRAGGANKANFFIGEKTILEHVRSEFAGYDIWIAGPKERFPEQKDVVLEDRYDAGPLGAMAGAWERIPAEWILFAACDMPYISGEMADVLYEEKEGNGVCFADDRMQPLFALLSRDSLPVIKRQIETRDRALRHCYETLKIKLLSGRDFGFSEKNFENWNTEHEERKNFP